MMFNFWRNKMAIWEFNQYNNKELKDIQTHIVALEDLGIEQNKDMIEELYSEMGERGIKKK